MRDRGPILLIEKPTIAGTAISPKADAQTNTAAILLVTLM